MKTLSLKIKKEVSRRVKNSRIGIRYQEQEEHSSFRDELVAWDRASAHDFRAFERAL